SPAASLTPALDAAAAPPVPQSSTQDSVASPSGGSSGAVTTGPQPEQGAQAEPPPLTPTMGTNTITINLSQILEAGDLSSNILVLPGDVVTVPHAGIVYVLGAVQRPGGYTVSNDRAQLTTLKLLSLAGGLNRTAKGSRAIVVRKDTTGKQTEVEVDLQKVM